MRVLFPFFSGVTEPFGKTKSEFLNSTVLASGFVMGCAQKVVENSAVIQKV